MISKAIVIDDDASSRKIVQYVFDLMGYKTSEAENGEMGSLQLLNEAQDILVLDWRMPKLNGGETLLLVDNILRQSSSKNHRAPMPIIIYTSVALDDLELPDTKYFRFKGYVQKKWSVDIQIRQFRRIMKSLTQGAA